MQGIVLTSNPDYADVAMQEVKNLFPDSAPQRLHDGVFWLETGAQLQTMQEKLLQQPPIFVQHLHTAFRQQVSSAPEIFSLVQDWLLSNMAAIPPGSKVAVQGRVMASPISWQPRDLKKSCDKLLLAAGLAPTIKDPEWIISVTQIGSYVYYGLSLASDNLSDWTGGMVHFRKAPSDISRAKFKLLEAIVRFNLSFPPGGKALDLGAAPGGWTQVLLSHGLQVVAIDTGELDPRLAAAPNLVFRQANVKNLRFAPTTQFDVVTCDMSWDPFFTVQMLNRLVEHIRPGGQVIMTVKLMGKQPLPTIERIVAALDKQLRVKHAQHLFHNRQEITLHLTKAS